MDMRIEPTSSDNLTSNNTRDEGRVSRFALLLALRRLPSLLAARKLNM